ncbi:MAG TPA: trehalase family glycosidase, partial [Patescibacteria group bacterium]
MIELQIDPQKLQKTLDYIDSYWEKIILMPRRHKVRKQVVDSVRMLIGKNTKTEHDILEVPYAAIVPNNSKYRYIFYWDTYFIFRGLIQTRNEWVIPSMIENFVYLFKRHHIIPNFSHPESLGRSQPPFFTSMIFDAYSVLERDKKITHKIKRIFHGKKRWLRSHIEVAKEEYQDVWQSPVSFLPTDYNHLVPEYQLNRYGNRDIGYPQPSEQESGWDMTSRFYNRCNDFLAVDLNSFLYKYESDFARASKILNNQKDEEFWHNVAESRKNNMQIFWNEEKGFFYDYDYVHKEQSEFESLAGFVPMWAGIASVQQAARMVEKIPQFESNYGLYITSAQSLPPIFDLSIFPKPFQHTMESIVQPKQWDYPNI